MKLQQVKSPLGTSTAEDRRKMELFEIMGDSLLNVTDDSRLKKGADRIMNFDTRIRYVVVLDSDGTPQANVGRMGAHSLEPEVATRALFLRAMLARGMSEGGNEFHGKVKTAIIQREKITLICFLCPGKTILISAEPDFPLRKVDALGRLVDKVALLD